MNFNTMTSAINHALDTVEARGLTTCDNERMHSIGFGPCKPTVGNTNRYTLQLFKGETQIKQYLHIQVFAKETCYELNFYVS